MGRKEKPMYKGIQKRVKTRTPHRCECGGTIPAGTVCIWYKTVAFRESDIGRNEWHEGYVCPTCEKELEATNEPERT